MSFNDVAVRVENLSKRYRIGLQDERHHTLVGTLLQLAGQPVKNLRRLRSLTAFGDDEHDAEDVIWALKDVSFEVKRGEVVGLIGRNGAGKSTILKILSRITYPTAGRVEINGRVGSLLEVGTGFHPELTGRENVYLNGTILGMRKAEVDRKFDEIVEFSGVGKFIDTPVKRYSSGMKVRLAFSVAAHLDPEILLVDEVLAVGDAGFQKKCLGKMRDVAKEGRTVLFVSHVMQAVRNLCERTLHVHWGKIATDGPTHAAIRDYLTGGEVKRSERSWNDAGSRPGDGRFKLKAVRVLDAQGKSSPMFRTSDPIRIQIEFELNEQIHELGVGFDLFSADGAMLFRSYQYDDPDKWPELSLGSNCLECVVPPGMLNGGEYVVRLCVLQQDVKWILNGTPELAFEMEFDHARSPYFFKLRRGVIAPVLPWRAVPHGQPDAGQVAPS
ncbi:MAG: ABC transporter ATP-binding protein [Anaerolineales bacterium]|jgi:lipopolysaccharide transport system ATP-binding protein|nr:ABC transporter ATP-binding protein [Anaerolineales bacterium]MDP7544338.1 ABC transporter ATP-binding protein [Anaerolineales bacterium]MDP7643399.1 ABC transporter ATP-binding protein [Anaerolineales bacterium]HJN42537.1 ABC transporter ATP-binding protein [Anaerolineales bacterium]|tara:strand:+ start:1943 stop:3268 length:1326 start_codon:yes stop_codon:yes gene_type:complete